MQRVALVAGGTGDIGRAICRELHQAGIRVAVGYANSKESAEALASALGGTAVLLRADEEPGATVRAVQDALGRLDILVNASGLNIESSAPMMRDEDWQSVLDVNLTFAFRLTRAVLPCMLPQRYGRIVHLSSVSGRAGGR